MTRISILTLVTTACLWFSAAPISAQDSRPVWKPGADSPFEVTTQLRPWTIRDEGWDTIFENMAMAGVNNVYLVAIMHEEWRPFHADKFPHNPARGGFQAEDSTIAFFPDMSRYGKIKPTLSAYDWIRETDWLAETIEQCRRRGLGVGVEISHFPLPQRLVRQHPDWQLKKIDGESWNPSRFCPNNPDVREYLLALFGDLAARYDLDYIQTCQYLFNPEDVSEGGTCFCEHCVREAAKSGLDLEQIASALRDHPNAQPFKDQWRAFRRDSTTKLYRELAEAIRRENPKCHLRLNDVYSWTDDPTKSGLSWKDLAPHIGSVVTQDHQEQKGRPDETFAYRKQWLTDVRAGFGPDEPIVCSIAPRMDATPDLVREGIRVAVEHPARINGLALKHYDGASFSLLRAFKQGMIDAGVQGLTPTLGLEVEEMELDGYAPFETELAEEWGVETTGTGKATGTFDHPSGDYDVRITYFDEKGSQSRVKLAIAGTERAAFTTNENVDCWRWRHFNNIHLNKGDTIALIGEAGPGDRARLDYIEFIPRRQ